MNKITFKFYGALRKYGNEMIVYADSVNDGMRSLCMQIDGLKRHMKHKYYRLSVNKREITETEYSDGINVNRDVVVRVTPRIVGSGKVGSFIFGAILTGIGLFTGLTPLTQLGVGLMLAGAASLLTKQPTFNQDYGGVEDSQSSSFSNLSNMVGQGKQIPRVYGEIVTGSVIASQGLSSRRIDSGVDINDIQQATYSRQAITPIAARDNKGIAYNIDRNCDSVRNAAVKINVAWS